MKIEYIVKNYFHCIPYWNEIMKLLKWIIEMAKLNCLKTTLDTKLLFMSWQHINNFGYLALAPRKKNYWCVLSYVHFYEKNGLCIWISGNMNHFRFRFKFKLSTEHTFSSEIYQGVALLIFQNNIYGLYMNAEIEIIKIFMQ